MDSIEEAYPEVTRFVVIDSTGVAYTAYDVGMVEFSLQDNGKTLKVFLSPQRKPLTHPAD
jgi:hypothetical protein